MPHTIPTEPVQSSNISEIGHCALTNRLIVKFLGGTRYCYPNITEDIFEKIKAAQSVGNAFHTHIRKPKKDFTQF